MSSKHTTQKATAYKRINEIDHILKRSSMYIGANLTTPTSIWILDLETGKSEKKVIDYNPAFDQLFLEVATNAYDNIPRSRKAKIDPGRVEVSISDRIISVYNEGIGIPVVIHDEEGIYTPELIFFNLRTSSNYDDEDERDWAGVNGLGVKIVAVLSKWVEIEIGDPSNKKRYVQRCENNMKTIHPPTISPYAKDQAYVKVSYEVDFDRFNIQSYSAEYLRVVAFNIASTSWTLEIPIIFNGKELDFTSIETYAKLFTDKAQNFLIHEDPQARLKMCLLDTPDSGFQLGFVNTLLCKKGGVHINETLRLFTAPILEKLNKKQNLFDIRDIKKHLSLIISCNVINPQFSTQTKDELIKPVPKVVLPASTIKAVGNWDFVKQLVSYADFKAGGSTTKVKAERPRHVIGIKEYEAANNAGGPESLKCVLILTEGLSAKTFAMNYRSCFPNGADWFGVMPLKGKGLNIQTANASQLATNAEVGYIRQILNIRPNADYRQQKHLRELCYGRILYATDADHDGNHIKGLGMNLFGTAHKSLFEMGFVCGLITPLVRATKGKQRQYFRDETEFNRWLEALTESEKKKWDILPYKGLGAWDPDEFTDPTLFRQICYRFDSSASDSLKLAFHKDHADSRKDWVSNPNRPPSKFSAEPPPLTLLDNIDKVSVDSHLLVRSGFNPSSVVGMCPVLSQDVSDFVNSELVIHSRKVNERAIPGPDGLKQSERRVYFSSLAKRLGAKPLKIAQFMGYVSEKTHYPYGEANVGGVIMGMCQDYVGSNNLPLLKGKGNVGTRLKNGKDASDPRYVFVMESPLAKYLFRKEDDVILDSVVIDNDIVEPKYYYPILCMTAINGVNGIGTGFSSKCPSFNPLDVLAWTRAWIRNHYPTEDEEGEVCYPVMIPWYRGFKGRVKQLSENRFQSEGVFTVEGNKVKISELPIDTSITDYAEFVDSLLANKLIKDFKKSSKPEFVDFTLIGFEKPTLASLKLTSTIATSNITQFDSDGYIVKYAGIDSLLYDSCVFRYKGYERRKGLLLDKLGNDLLGEELKIRFIQAVLDKDKPLQLVSNPNLKEQMIEMNLPDHLLKMAIDSITEGGLERYQKSAEKIRVKIEEVKSHTSRRAWESDLLDFEKAYRKAYPRFQIR